MAAGGSPGEPAFVWHGVQSKEQNANLMLTHSLHYWPGHSFQGHRHRERLLEITLSQMNAASASARAVVRMRSDHVGVQVQKDEEDGRKERASAKIMPCIWALPEGLESHSWPGLHVTCRAHLKKSALLLNLLSAKTIVSATRSSRNVLVIAQPLVALSQFSRYWYGLAAAD